MNLGNVAVFAARGAGVALASLGGIWVARALGPEKLGMSTLVFAFVTLVSGLSSLNQNYNFVRRGKNLTASTRLEELVGDVFSLRLGLVIILLAAGLTVVSFIGAGSQWYLAIFAGAILALLQSNDAGWVLQLKDRMPWLFIAISAQSAITGVLCIALIRPDWPAGSDLAMGCFGAAAAFSISWWFACGGWPPRFRVGLRGFVQGLKLLKGGRWLALMGVGGLLVSTAGLPMISALASVEELGVYRAALQFINVVNPFLPLFFYRLYPQLIDLQRDAPGEILSTQFRALGKVALFGIPLAVVAFFLAPWVYPLVFGPAYSGAALPFAILFSAKIVSVGCSIFMWGGFAGHRDREIVLSTLAIACLSLGLNWLLIPQMGLVGAALVSLIAQILLLSAYISVVVCSRRSHINN
jgi:O-antigen/teichoic acid export membrane protein